MLIIAARWKTTL